MKYYAAHRLLSRVDLTPGMNLESLNQLLDAIWDEMQTNL